MARLAGRTLSEIMWYWLNAMYVPMQQHEHMVPNRFPTVPNRFPTVPDETTQQNIIMMAFDAEPEATVPMTTESETILDALLLEYVSNPGEWF